MEIEFKTSPNLYTKTRTFVYYTRTNNPHNYVNKSESNQIKVALGILNIYTHIHT